MQELLCADDWRRVFRVMRCFADEWGPENVIVAMPRSWEKYGINQFGRIRLEFVTEDSLVIRVEYGSTHLIHAALIPGTHTAASQYELPENNQGSRTGLHGRFWNRSSRSRAHSPQK